jgi:hypothetical protein
MSREEIVELADAIAVHDGIAAGIGTSTYGAMLVVEAADREAAMTRGSQLLVEAAARAGLPPWSITSVRAMSEGEADEYDFGDE